MHDDADAYIYSFGVQYLRVNAGNGSFANWEIMLEMRNFRDERVSLANFD